MYLAKSRKLRAAYEALVMQLNPNAFITLDEGLGVTPLKLNGDAKKFLNALQHRARGRNWAKWDASHWPSAVGFMEVASKRHLHIAAAMDEDLRRALRTDGKEIWREIRKGGSFDYDPPEDQHAVARYITKRVSGDTDYDNVFTYSRSEQV